MENWSYQHDGAIKGPASKDHLRSLYEAGEITRQTLVRSSLAKGEWRRYGDVAGLAPSRIPPAVKNFWPWFVFGTPLLGGLIDVCLIRSSGHEFVETNAAWLSHVPTALNVLAVALWLILIAIGFQKRNSKDRIAGMAVWLIAAPLYLTFSWWTTVLTVSLINMSLGSGLPECQADLTKAQVKDLFDRISAKSGHAGVNAVALMETRQQWLTGRTRMCTGKLAATNAQTYSVRYEIEHHGTRLFLRKIHGFDITMVIE
jgi:hypothetical protein